MRKIIAAMFVLMPALVLASCGDSESAKKLQQSAGETWDAMKSWGAEQKDALVKKAGEGLAGLESSMATAKVAAQKAGGDASRSLDEAWKTAQEKFAALKSSSAEGYAKARDEMIAAYEALRAKLGKSK